ncbi:MAG: metallophosphoesterase, partial [Oscillospiraceae bacterium]|nr:metallophosphoesterase [Oscillospiraceae bacterium]
MRKIMPAGKKIALGFGAAVAATAVIHLVSCATLDRITQYVYTDYTSEKISPALDGYKLVFISDIHDLPEKKLMETVEQINKENADLMLIGGDFPRGEAMLRAFAYLSGINAADGIFGVGGNHDRPSEYFSAMESFGITPLRNNGIFTLENLYLCGVEDKKRGNADVRAAVSGAKPDDFTVLLSHSPDVLFDQDIGIPALALS